jgi:hypothetical protein
MSRKKMITQVLAAGGFALAAAATLTGQAQAADLPSVQAEADQLEEDLAALTADVNDLPAADPVTDTVPAAPGDAPPADQPAAPADQPAAPPAIPAAPPAIPADQSAAPSDASQNSPADQQAVQQPSDAGQQQPVQSGQPGPVVPQQDPVGDAIAAGLTDLADNVGDALDDVLNGLDQATDALDQIEAEPATDTAVVPVVPHPDQDPVGDAIAAGLTDLADNVGDALDDVLNGLDQATDALDQIQPDKPATEAVTPQSDQDPIGSAITAGLTSLADNVGGVLDNVLDGLDALDKELDQIQDEPVTDTAPAPVVPQPDQDPVGDAIATGLTSLADNVGDALDDVLTGLDQATNALDQIQDEPATDTTPEPVVPQPEHDPIAEAVTNVLDGVEDMLDHVLTGLDTLDEELDKIQDEPAPPASDEPADGSEYGVGQLLQAIDQVLGRLHGLLDQIPDTDTVETVETVDTVQPDETVETDTAEAAEPATVEPVSVVENQGVQVPAEVVRAALQEQPQVLKPQAEKADTPLAYTGLGDPLPAGLAGLTLVALGALLARRKRTAPHNN